MKTREKTYTEYEESPSGSIYFYNYKEPLMKFEEGFGFEGALVYAENTDQIQCHFCGGWFDILGHHLHKEHNMTARDYKKKVGLNISTALISEKHRALLIRKGLEKRVKNLRSPKSVSKETRAKISATLKENRAEKKNQNNTCPEQLLERLVKKYNELGYTPSPKRDIPFREALCRTYGSYENACKLVGIPYRKPGLTRKSGLNLKWTRDAIVKQVIRFYQENGRLPKAKEYKAYDRPLAKYGKKHIFKLALSSDGVYKKAEFIARYDKPTLINFLRMFKTNNNRYPSVSDCKRGLLPHASRYIYHWKSWNIALKVAFPNYERPVKSPYTPKPRVKGLNQLERMSMRLARYKHGQI